MTLKFYKYLSDPWMHQLSDVVGSSIDQPELIVEMNVRFQFDMKNARTKVSARLEARALLGVSPLW
ncbi:MAG TPA: hypothetical protein VFZ61_30740 [Polyangiales bacterium]